MRARAQSGRGKGALELVEEAFHLLRLAPSRVYATYLTGSVPFVLGFLFFWADMSRSAFARERCAEKALLLALLYLWMKWWQAVFAGQLRARLNRGDPPPWNLRRVWRLVASQSIPHPYVGLVLPLSALVIIPFIWVYAFFQNVTCLGDDETKSPGDVFRDASRQACVWPRQNLVLILIFGAFGFFVFLNVASVLFAVPYLLKMFAGFESTFTLSGSHAVNTTFFAAAAAITYLGLAPVVKAAYVLRCFYGEAIHSGLDLKADLMRVQERT